MRAWVWLLLGVAASAVSWTYTDKILLPWEHYIKVERGPVKEQLGDLYPRWVGAKELLLNGRNPYSPEVSHEIQLAYYGHPVEQNYDKPASEVLDEQRFAYPVYIVFLLAPTVNVDFAKLQAWTPLVLGAFTALSIFLWLGVLRWKPSFWVIVTLELLVLSSPQVAQGLRLRQLGLFAAFLLAFATWCIVRNRLLVGGILLAVATIKPQLTVLPLFWFLIWALGDWRKRWHLAAGFGVTLGLLAGAGDVLVPGWVRYFLTGLEAYPKYFPTGAQSIVRVIFGNWIGAIVSIFAVIVLAGYGWKQRRTHAETPEFWQTLSLFFIGATAVMPLLPPYNQVLLLLPLLSIIPQWDALPRWARTGFGFSLAWPSLVMIAMLLYPPNLQSLGRTPLLPSVLLPLIPFVVLWITFILSRSSVRVAESS